MDARRGRPGRARSRGAGFTLIELLVVMAVITILAGITVPATFRIWKHGREVSCRNNLNQIGKGLFMYSHEWDRYFPCNRRYKGATRPRGYDDLSPLYGVRRQVKDKDGKLKEVRTSCFVPDLRAFNCPSTRDFAKSPLEIRFKRSEEVPDGAPTEVPRKQQLSYEYCGEYNPSLQYARTNTRTAWLAHDEDCVAEAAGGASMIQESFGKGNGTATLSGTLSSPVIVAGTVELTFPTASGTPPFYVTDDGNEAWTGHGGMIATGTIDYQTGEFQIQFKTAVGNPWTIGSVFEYVFEYEQESVKVALALNPLANHRLRGGNMLFLDSRVEWITPLEWAPRVLGGMQEWTRVTGWSD